ncbi:DinB family protein [Chitinophaga japonensis]|uniref:DinB family protein n=1 Tax=Chitinophaga japonensis TaxID=104662 RepID=A0A562TCC0_CHIJA|nr:DinB family protein [Chitinophaga japonensis]TWI90928.1 DinB family protein [Chitinophaga japonensis]
MAIASAQLIAELSALTRQHKAAVELLRDRKEEELAWRASVQSWNILECLEHLNLYGRFYLPEIEKRIQATKTRPDEQFTPGFIGNYFANSMLPKGKLNRMQTFKNMNPIYKDLDMRVLDTFLHQQDHMLELLQRAAGVSLNRVKTGISITGWVRLKLGDTFRVVVYHNERHMQQVKRIWGEMAAMTAFATG